MTPAVQSSSQMPFVATTSSNSMAQKQIKTSVNVPSMSPAVAEMPKATSGHIGTRINTKV